MTSTTSNNSHTQQEFSENNTEQTIRTSSDAADSVTAEELQEEFLDDVTFEPVEGDNARNTFKKASSDQSSSDLDDTQNPHQSSTPNDSDDSIGYSDEDLDDSVVAEGQSAAVIKKLKDTLQKTQKERQEYLDSWQRERAEFLNARKRDEDERKNVIKFAEQAVIEELFPALDSFEMAMSNKESWESVSAEWRRGVEGIYNQLTGVLEKRGVLSFGKIGDTFDPALHQSVKTDPITDNTQKEDTISLVFQKGYTLHGKVIRPAMVAVYSK
jgi:molecular chaperone GrpE